MSGFFLFCFEKSTVTAAHVEVLQQKRGALIFQCSSSKFWFWNRSDYFLLHLTVVVTPRTVFSEFIWLHFVYWVSSRFTSVWIDAVPAEDDVVVVHSQSLLQEVAAPASIIAAAKIAITFFIFSNFKFIKQTVILRLYFLLRISWWFRSEHQRELVGIQKISYCKKHDLKLWSWGLWSICSSQPTGF